MDPFAFDCPQYDRVAFEEDYCESAHEDCSAAPWFEVSHEEHERSCNRRNKRRKRTTNNKENVTDDDVFALLDQHNKRRKSSDQAKHTKRCEKKRSEEVFELLEEHNKRKSKTSSKNQRKNQLEEWKTQKNKKKTTQNTQNRNHNTERRGSKSVDSESEQNKPDSPVCSRNSFVQANFCAAPTPNLITTKTTLVSNLSGGNHATSSKARKRVRSQAKNKEVGAQVDNCEEQEMLKLIAQHNRGLSQAQSS